VLEHLPGKCEKPKENQNRKFGQRLTKRMPCEDEGRFWGNESKSQGTGLRM
jgi:hypothetical protein